MENHVEHALTLTVEQAAKLLGIGRSTAYELVHTGDIPSLRLGRRIVVPVARLAELLTATPDSVATASDGPASVATQPSKGARARTSEDVPTLF